MYKKYFKRWMDIKLAILLLIAFSPLILLTFILLAICNHGKVFFIQPRPGMYGQIFNIIKFRTMDDKTDGQGDLLPDMERLTTVGKVLRKFSIDELPQLINVLKGDLSMIGPRPLLVEYLTLYSPQQNLRHSVKPGITGLAQVNGRNASSWEKRFELDNYYVDHLSFLLDVKIFFMTILNILRMEGIGSSHNITKEKFTGSKSA
jgi:undecaprenyl phosphate N,N'-diacetylbacillosamine 1-phosphate transferase